MVPANGGMVLIHKNYMLKTMRIAQAGTIRELFITMELGGWSSIPSKTYCAKFYNRTMDMIKNTILT